MGASTSMAGIGATPVQLLAVDRNAVFTYPDETHNRMLMAILRGDQTLSLHQSSVCDRLLPAQPHADRQRRSGRVGSVYGAQPDGRRLRRRHDDRHPRSEREPRPLRPQQSLRRVGQHHLHAPDRVRRKRPGELRGACRRPRKSSLRGSQRRRRADPVQVADRPGTAGRQPGDGRHRLRRSDLAGGGRRDSDDPRASSPATPSLCGRICS